MLDNGLIQFEVIGKFGEVVRCRSLQDAKLGSRRHVNLPGAETDLPSTGKDKKDALVGIECDHDFFALSFTRDGDAIDLFRSFLRENNSSSQIIAKIEDQQGVKNLEEIITAADGLMIARGDLGIECAFEELPIIQRNTVGFCQSEETGDRSNPHARVDDPVPVPTRAEISDIANSLTKVLIVLC